MPDANIGDISWATTIISAILGLIAGAIGSLVAPWIQWGIEKRRMKVQYRRELIANWRTLLHDVSYSKVTANGEIKYESLKNLVEGHPHYLSLYRHLDKKTRLLLAKTGGTFWSSDETDAAYEAILADVNVAEQKWDLV